VRSAGGRAVDKLFPQLIGVRQDAVGWVFELREVGNNVKRLRLGQPPPPPQHRVFVQRPLSKAQ
jgi:hypothetical protein